MLKTLILALLSYAGTNLDDLLLTVLLYADAKTEAERRGVVTGKFLGIGFLLLISLLGAYGAQFLPERCLRFLGLIPIALGIKAIIDAWRRDSDDLPTTGSRARSFTFRTALITVANGGDNIGVYLPLFAGFNVWQLVLTLVIYALLTALSCVFGHRLADLPPPQHFLQRRGQAAIPVVYIALGLYILFY